MLPFYVRDTRRGRGAKKRRHDEIEDEGGGPVQIAITNDLIDLRKRFRERLLERTKEGRPLPPSLWTPGSAFSIFKDVFGASKIAILHLLSPARCDREAYSQLIYGACLAFLKDSFGKIQSGTMGETNHREEGSSEESVDHFSDAGFAIFLLLALFETNPLPRDIDNENPLHILPIGSRVNDDSRIPNQRCFLKNIRIDQEHFSLLLRLKELALARRSDCERLFFKLQSLALQDVESCEGQSVSAIGIEPRILSHHAVSSDIVEVLARIFPNLELCEYTGPLSAEAFAGHHEYPHKFTFQERYCEEKTTSCSQIDSETTSENQSSHIENSNGGLDDLMSSFQKYKTSVNKIRIPPSKSSRVRRLQNALQPLFSQITSIQSHDSKEIKSHHFMENSRSFLQIESYPNDLESQRDHGDYRVIVDKSINTNLKKALHTSVMALLARDDLLSPLSGIINNVAKPSVDADDVSSIGHGGISIATRVGEPATLGLRSANGKNARSKTRFKHLKQAVSKQGLATKFLTSKQSASSDEGSVDSEITVSSFSDTDSIEDDEVSVATSAFGKKALSDLLENVTREDIDIRKSDYEKKGKKKKRRQKIKSPKKQNNKKQRVRALSPSTNENEEDELMSTATSAFGKKALEDLLKHADKKAGGVRKTDAKKLRSKKQAPNLSSPKLDNDEESVATSAFGKRALDQLLKNAVKTNDDERKDAKKRRTKNQAPEISSPLADGEEISVATSAFGKKALEDLLLRAERKTSNQKPKPAKKQQKRGPITKASSKESSITKTDYNVENPKENSTGSSRAKDGEEDTSVATSAFGKRALEHLLQNVDDDED